MGGGINTLNNPGVYGTLGTPDAISHLGDICPNNREMRT
jgi:hypothetical protein